MTTRELIRKIVRERDANGAFRLAQSMSLRYGMTYRELHEFVNRTLLADELRGEPAIEPIAVAEWDELLREGERT